MAHRDIMHTSNPGYEYSFCWTIDDFHKMPSFVVQGPAFSPIPGCSDQFCFQVEFRPGQRIPPTFVIYVAPTTPNTNVYSNFYFRLLDLTSNVHHRTVHGTVTLQNTKGTLCDITFNDRIIIEKFTELMTYDINCTVNNNSDEVDAMIILSLSGLADGKLTLHGSLRFTGFLVTSSIYSISVPKPSEELGELANDFKSLYESGSGSDVTFTVGDQVLPAHKLVLGARSEVFAKMFEHRMLESNTNNVIIDDIDPDAFNKFLLFLYTGALEGADDCESHLDVYAVAHRYQVKSLQKMCVGLLGNSLTSDSLCESLVLADLCNDEEFKGMVKFLLRKNFFDVVSTAKWAEIVTTKPELAKEITDYMKPVQN